MAEFSFLNLQNNLSMGDLSTWFGKFSGHWSRYHFWGISRMECTVNLFQKHLKQFSVSFLLSRFILYSEEKVLQFSGSNQKANLKGKGKEKGQQKSKSHFNKSNSTARLKAFGSLSVLFPWYSLERGDWPPTKARIPFDFFKAFVDFN